jgi:hypothetical protein
MVPPRVLLLAGVLLTAAPAIAGERVDLFDTKGQRQGYAIVDQTTGRVDFYDNGSRRTGYGKVDPAGKVQRFGLDGTRQEDGTALPIGPRKGNDR